jgi:hypothetical protein
MKHGAIQFLSTDERIDYHGELLDIPSIIRYNIPISDDIPNNKKEFMRSRRIVVSPLAFTELGYTLVQVPKEIFEIPFEGGCLVQFETDGNEFEFNGLKFNHVSVLQTGSGSYHLATYTEDGHGPLQFEFVLDGISNDNDIIDVNSIEEYVTRKFGNIIEVASFNEKGQLVLTLEDQIQFVEAYFGDHGKFIRKRWEMNVNRDDGWTPVFSSIFATFAQFALDEMGLSALKLNDINSLEARIYDFSKYWFNVISNLFNMIALLNIKDFDEPPFEQTYTEELKSIKNKRTGEKKKKSIPYLKISSTSKSKSLRQSSTGMKLSGAVLTRGHTRRQWIKHVDNYQKVFYRSRSINGEICKSPYVVKWIKWFWKGQEKEEILTAKQVNVGNKPSSVSWHQSRMAAILEDIFTVNFHHDKYHSFLENKLGKKYRIDGFVDAGDIKFAVEIDGLQHYEYVPRFHRQGEIGLELQQETDRIKDSLCESAGVPLARIDARYWDGEEGTFWDLMFHQLPEELVKKIEDYLIL